MSAVSRDALCLQAAAMVERRTPMYCSSAYISTTAACASTKTYPAAFGETQPLKGLRSRLFRRFLRQWPVFKENQTTIAVRDRRTEQIFDIPETVHPTLRSL